VYFRDTAQGFLAWAVASLATAGLLGSLFASVAGAGQQAGASVAGATASTATVAAVRGKTRPVPGTEGESMSCFVDSMFRRQAGASAATPLPTEVSEGAAAKNAAEAGRIFMSANGAETLPPEDLLYVGQIVAQRTGLPGPEAEKRVADTYARVQAAQRAAEAAGSVTPDRPLLQPLHLMRSPCVRFCCWFSAFPFPSSS
jgi:hypothetical protein